MRKVRSYSEFIDALFKLKYRQRGSDHLTVLEPVVPGIETRMLDVAVYLYPTVEDAEQGSRVGGTGFLVEVESESFPARSYVYAVSNQHVVLRDDDLSSRVIRFGKTNGNTSEITQPLETLASDWRKHPEGDDLAICYLGHLQDAAAIDHELCVKECELAKTFEQVRQGRRVMVGDDVFMIGRYIDKDGVQHNEPSIRFGNISMFPGTPVELPDGRRSRVFFVDLRSHGGYSGSPLFVYVSRLDFRISFTTSREIPDAATDVKRDGLWLLGIDAGHHSVLGEVWEGFKRMEGVTAVLPAGMARVVPAWKLREMLDDKMSVKERLDSDAEYRSRQPAIPLHRDDASNRANQ